MICKKCGMDNPEGTRACIRCGAELTDKDIKVVNVTDSYENRVDNSKNKKEVVFFPQHIKGENKFKTGLICGLLFSILGFLGVFVYSKDSQERSTFAKGWLIGFIIQDIVAVVTSLIMYL